MNPTLKAFGEKTGTPQEPPAEGSIGVYVDASVSMRGFAAASDSVYVQVLQEALNASGNVGWKATWNSFGSGGGTQVTTVASTNAVDLLQPSFYNRADRAAGAEFALVEAVRAATAPTQGAHGAIIVTDLAAPGGALQPLAGEFQKMARNGMQVHLMAFRSAYSGAFAAEYDNGQSSVNVNVSNGRTGRPFYILTIASDPGTMRQIVKNVHDRLRAWKPAEFQPSAAPIRVKAFDVPGSRTNSAPWRSVAVKPDRLDPAAAAAGAPQFIYSSFQEGATPKSSGKASLDAKLAYVAAIPFRDARNFEVEVQQFKYRDGKFAAVTTPPNLEVQRSGACEPRMVNLEFTYRFDRPLPGTYDIYQVQYRPGASNLVLPEWIEKWSTKDDRRAAAATTYQLAEISRSMLNALAGRQVFLTHYLAVGRED